ncbi:hypothetical protein [Peribacillus frigoritolerans]|uniref:Uncharacterized protein n=1 Tax=Peribacillus castrilensis TaxID=2897690 RepID=A0AAW9NBG7_9BACI|nr:hypothetical protein [Peribacillus castrilensis]
MTRKSDLAELPKEKILYILSIAGNHIISENYNFYSNQMNDTEISKSLTHIQNIDWSSEGSLKYLKGVSGSNLLAADLITSFKN